MFVSRDLVGDMGIVFKVQKVLTGGTTAGEVTHPIDNTGALAGRHVNQIDVKPTSAEHAVEDV